jgi:hypothetical protein
LEPNGRGSSGKRTRHIAVRYFFIADRVKSKEIRIEYFPTAMMLADYFTKPLQGALFRKMREMIMGNIPIELPNEIVTDIPDGIPDLSPIQESRSVLDIDGKIKLSRVTDTVSPVKEAIHPMSDKDVMRAKAPRNPKDKVLSWSQVVVNGSKR